MSAHRVFAASAGLAAILALSACSAGSGAGDGPLATLFGESPASETSEPQSFEELAGSNPAPCPRPEVIQGQAAARFYRGGRTGSNRDLRYQISVVDIARECALTPEGLNSVKVGVQGRVLIGPAGSPGTFTAPVRIVVRTPSAVFEERSRRISVTVPAGQSFADFRLVEEDIDVPLSAGANFLIEVGIDG